MSQRIGKYYPVSHFRRLVADLLQFAAAVPSATIERRMDLSRLMESPGKLRTPALPILVGHFYQSLCRGGGALTGVANVVFEIPLAEVLRAPHQCCHAQRRS